MSAPRFYVYVLARPDGRPFYVGKGSGRRIHAHESEARSGHQCHKCNVIRKIWRSGGDVARYFVLETDDEQEAFAYERELIALHGQDYLCNQTEGGEGTSGYTLRRWQNPEYRAHIKQKRLEGWADPEQRARRLAALRRPETRAKLAASVSEQHKREWADPEYRSKMVQVLKDRWADPEYRARLGETHKSIWADPEYRARMTALRQEACNRPEYLEKLSTRVKEMWTKSDYQEFQASLQREKWADPEVRARRESGMKAAREKDGGAGERARLEKSRATMQTPEYRAKQSAANKAKWADPEYREKMLARFRDPEYRAQQAAKSREVAARKRTIQE